MLKRFIALGLSLMMLLTISQATVQPENNYDTGISICCDLPYSG